MKSRWNNDCWFNFGVEAQERLPSFIVYIKLDVSFYIFVCADDFKIVSTTSLALLLLFRPHLWGEELSTQMGFFVQTILADRYIHRRKMRVVSLKSSSSVELEIKKIFLNLVFSEELSRFKVLCEHRKFGMILFTFSLIFVQIKIFFFKNINSRPFFRLLNETFFHS